MVSMTKRSDASSDRLPLVYRATLAFAVGSFAVVVPVLAAVVLFAWLVHFRWLPNWLVNLLGVLIAFGALFLVWRTLRFLSLRGYRFSLQTAMIFVAMLAVTLSFLGNQLRYAAREHRAIQALGKDGSGAEYYLKSYEDSAWFCWLIIRFGHDPFATVTEVNVLTDGGVQTILEHHAEFADLEILRLFRVTDQGLERVDEFNRFSNVQFVDFRGSPVTDAGIEQISHWTNLPALGLYGCNRVTDAGLAHLVDMPALEELCFISEGGANTTLTDAGLAHVGKMHNLKHFKVLGLPFTDAGLEHLRPLAGLRTLLISKTKVTRQGIERLQQALPKCDIRSDVN